jgi:hypothetical protein
MTVRLGMVNSIAELRRICDASENESTVNGVAYWTDQQIQDVLDNHAEDVTDVLLTARPLREGSSTVYKRYYIPKTISKWMEHFTEAEETANALLDAEDQLDATPLFEVRDANGNLVTNYTYNRARRLIEFDSDTNANYFYLRATDYDIEAAASELWTNKAAHRAQLIRWKAGDHQLHEDQEWAHCMKMAEHYSRTRGAQNVVMIKTDYA